MSSESEEAMIHGRIDKIAGPLVVATGMTKAKELRVAMGGHVIAQDQLVGMYERK